MGKTKATIIRTEGTEEANGEHAYDQDPNTSFTVETGDDTKSPYLEVNFNTYVTIDSIRFRTSNKFMDAVNLEGAQVFVGKEECGYVP